MIKRETIILPILIMTIFLLFGTSFVSADDYDNYGIFVNDSKLDKTATVRVMNGFGYVSLNQIMSNLNISIREDKANNLVTITSGVKTIKITNATQVELNGNKKIQMDVPFILKGNDIYIPILGLVDLLGYQVEVMDDIKCLRIKTPSSTTLTGKLIDTELNAALPVSKAISSSYPRVAYLTFDDGLDSKVTPMILDILKKENVKATFFIVGNTIEKNKSLLNRMIEEGHSIGNHTYTHIKENIYSSGKSLQIEINKTNDALYNVAGITTNLFRPPYGGTYIRRDELKTVLTPYKTILWNVDSLDSSSRTISSNEILNHVVRQVKSKKSAVIIMHDSGTHIETAKALPGIIKYLKENGFTILPIYENTNIYYQY